MTTDTAEAKSDGRKRGGQRGERPWRDKPTARERVMTQSLAEYVKSECDKDVSPETVRAVRFCLPKWSNDPTTKSLRDNMDKKLEKAKLQDKRERALAMLKEAEGELSKFSDEGDLDDDDDDETDDDEADSTDYEDDSDDDSDDEDIFNETPAKVSSNFG